MQTPIISMASTTSTLLSQEVYLTDRLDNPTRERMPHLKCICFLRPSQESLRALENELREPKYASYWLYFSNVLKKSQIERLAEADEGELVREVQVRWRRSREAAAMPYTMLNLCSAHCMTADCRPIGILRGLLPDNLVAHDSQLLADTSVAVLVIYVSCGDLPHGQQSSSIPCQC